VHGEVLRRGSMLRQDRSHVLPRDISVKGHSSIVQAPQKHCTGFGLTRRTYLQPATHMAPDGHCTGQSDAIRPDSEAENANHKRCTPPAWLNLNTLWKILQSRYTALSRNATVGAHRRQGRNRTPPLGVARAQRMPPPTCDRSVAGSASQDAPHTHRVISEWRSGNDSAAHRPRARRVTAFASRRRRCATASACWTAHHQAHQAPSSQRCARRRSVERQRKPR